MIHIVWRPIATLTAVGVLTPCLILLVSALVAGQKSFGIVYRAVKRGLPPAGDTASRSLPSGLSDPDTVRYIKPGQGGQWRQMAFDNGLVPFDCYGIDHALCLNGDWDAVMRELVRSGVQKPKDALRQLRDFYELPETAVWFTIADGRLYSTFADTTVHVAPWPSSGSQNDGVKPRAGGAAIA